MVWLRQTMKVINTGRATHMFASQYLGSRDLKIEGADVEGAAPNGVKYVKLQPRKSAEIKFTSAQPGTFAAGRAAWANRLLRRGHLRQLPRAAPITPTILRTISGSSGSSSRC